MSDTVIVVPEPDPEPTAAVAEEGGVAAGMALAAATGAAQDAAEAVAVAESAAAVAETALAEAAVVQCCEHCADQGLRLMALEEGRAEELTAALEAPVLDAPAPAVKEKPAPKEASEKPAVPAARKGFWPV